MNNNETMGLDLDFRGELIFDGGYESVDYPPTCVRCRHWSPGDALRCAAFPKSDIPLEIWVGKNPHNDPYPGDRGIRFEPIDS